MSIAGGLANQFERGWKMIGRTIEQTPDDLWRTAGKGYLCPARLAYHIVETIDFYIYDGEQDQFGSRFGDWEEPGPEELPSREEVLGYMREVRGTLNTWLGGYDDTAIRGPNEAHPWCGDTILELALYVLRHTLHHHGEMNALLVLEAGGTDNWE
jgi:hypothetical protein